MHSSNKLQDQQITTHLDWFVPYLCQFQSHNNSTSLWLITKSVKWRLLIPFKTNSAKYQPIQNDFGALSAIYVFQSLNKHSPLVAVFRIGCINSACTFQDQLSQISAHSDWFGPIECHFCVSVTKKTWPPGGSFQNWLHELCVYPSEQLSQISAHLD